MGRKYMQLLLVFVSVFLLQGCSYKSMTNTLFDANSEYDNDGGISTIKQTRIMTVNSLASIEEVGQVYFLDPRRGSETAVYLDIDLNLEKNVRYYKSNLTKEQLMDIRNSFTRLDKQLRDLLKMKKDVVDLELKQKIQKLDAMKNGTTFDNSEIQKEITLKESKIDELSKSFMDKSDKLLDNLRTSNAILFKVNAEKEKDGGITFGKLIGVGGNKKTSSVKLVLASGLQTERVRLGKDEIKTLNETFNKESQNKIGIITYTLSAEHLTYLTKRDLTSLFSLNLDVNLKKYPELLKKIDELKLFIALSNVENSLSGGFFSKPKLTKEKVVLKKCKEEGHCKIDEKAYRNIFFTVYTRINNLDKLFADVKGK